MWGSFGYGWPNTKRKLIMFFRAPSSVDVYMFEMELRFPGSVKSMELKFYELAHIQTTVS